MSLLITGATGFIGKAIIDDLKTYNQKIFIIVRPHSIKKAFEYFKKYDHVKIISGDLTNNFVLDDINDLSLLDSVSELIHLGGKYDIEMKESDAYMQNVVGTQNIIALSKRLPSLNKVHHVSSFSVIGTDLKKASASDFTNEESKLSCYAKSKMYSEKLMRAFAEENTYLSLIVYRPGVVVPGFRRDLEKIDGPYYFVQSMLKVKKLLSVMPKTIFIAYPFSEGSYIPLVSVESVGKFISSKIDVELNERISSYYIVGDKKISVRRFMERVLFYFGKDLIIKPLPEFLGRKLNTGFGLMPKELHGFGFFKTDLVDVKTNEDQKIINDLNVLRISDLIDQMESFNQGRNI